MEIDKAKTGFENLLVCQNNILMSAGFWDTDSTKCLKSFEPQKGASCLVLSQSGSVISGDRDGTLLEQDTSSERA